MDWFAFTPHDSLFFRDGQPFNQDDEGLNTAQSRFPPAPSVTVGAFRASLAGALGWDPAGGGSWADKEGLRELLGDGPDDLGRLRFRWPLLARRRDGDVELCFPAPRYLFAAQQAEDGRELALVSPGQQVFSTDCGGQRLIAPAPRGFEPLAQHYLTAAGIEAVLQGRTPGADALIDADDLWQPETRIGLAIDAEARTARHGMLYQVCHVRTRVETALVLAVDGLLEGKRPATPTALGGFQRLADIEPIDPPSLPGHQTQAIRTLGGLCRYVVVLLTPARLEGGQWAEPGTRLAPELPGEIVTGLVDRPEWIGGWDGRPSADGRHRFRGPLPLEPYLPAGSVFFMECGPADLPSHWPHAIGARRKMGFGACLIGGWPASSTDQQEA